MDEKICYLNLMTDDSFLTKCNEIQNKFKEKLGIAFHSNPIYDEKYIKTKVKVFNGIVNTVFLDKNALKESIHYTCIAAINIDSVMEMNKKNYPQIYLEECK